MPQLPRLAFEHKVREYANRAATMLDAGEPLMAEQVIDAGLAHARKAEAMLLQAQYQLSKWQFETPPRSCKLWQVISKVDYGDKYSTKGGV